MQLYDTLIQEKLTFRTTCNIMVEKILAENRIRYAQRGDYACLVDMEGSENRRRIVVAPQLLDLPKHKQHRKETTINTDTSRCNAHS